MFKNENQISYKIQGRKQYFYLNLIPKSFSSKTGTNIKFLHMFGTYCTSCSTMIDSSINGVMESLSLMRTFTVHHMFGIYFSSWRTFTVSVAVLHFFSLCNRFFFFFFLQGIVLKSAFLPQRKHTPCGLLSRTLRFPWPSLLKSSKRKLVKRCSGGLCHHEIAR